MNKVGTSNTQVNLLVDDQPSLLIYFFHKANSQIYINDEVKGLAKLISVNEVKVLIVNNVPMNTNYRKKNANLKVLNLFSILYFEKPINKEIDVSSELKVHIKN